MIALAGGRPPLKKHSQFPKVLWLSKFSRTSCPEFHREEKGVGQTFETHFKNGSIGERCAVGYDWRVAVSVALNELASPISKHPDSFLVRESEVKVILHDLSLIFKPLWNRPEVAGEGNFLYPSIIRA